MKAYHKKILSFISFNNVNLVQNRFKNSLNIPTPINLKKYKSSIIKIRYKAINSLAYDGAASMLLEKYLLQEASRILYKATTVLVINNDI